MGKFCKCGHEKSVHVKRKFQCNGTNCDCLSFDSKIKPEMVSSPIKRLSVKALLKTGKVQKKDLNCDLCGYNCFNDEYIYVEQMNNIGYCGRCFDGRQKK